MLDRLTGIRVFLRTAQVGTLSGAARHLDLSPGMATKHLDALERHLGLRLFQRSTRKLRLTEAGQSYLDGIAHLLPAIDEVEAAVASRRVDVTGTLRINCSISFGVGHVAPLIPAFRAAHPNVSVELGLNDRIVDLLDEGWDLTIRMGRQKDSRLVTRKLADCAMIVCAAPGYWVQHGRPSRAAGLADHDCLGFATTEISTPDRWTFGRDREIVVPIRATLVSNNGDALLAAAVAGMGVVYLPEFVVADAIERGDLEPIALDHPTADFGGIHMVHVRDRTPPAKVRAMMDFLTKAFGSKQTWRRS